MEEFSSDTDIPPYAILSHTWEKDKVLFHDWERGNIAGKAGLRRIELLQIRYKIISIRFRLTRRFCFIAKRMSWAASRKTTKTEDMAYCLLGIFSIIMPLLYSEGWYSFCRLQEQIIKRNADLIIVAWDSPPGPSSLDNFAQTSCGSWYKKRSTGCRFWIVRSASSPMLGGLPGG